jgi:hypothetical protein
MVVTSRRKTTTMIYQESPIDHPDHLRNGGNKQEEDDNDDLPRIAN